ncbi:MAG: recombinase family protein [Bacteroidota bacterium]
MDSQLVRAVGYGRCSTSELRQDVELQLKELRRYCEAFGWAYDEVWEYGSGYKADKQPKLDEILERIRLKHYNVILVYSVDRFSRQSPSKINALLDTIVEQHKCRFIALQQGIDSENELTWHVVKPLFTYFANKYSKDLGDKVRKGIALKKSKGAYNGGRPTKRLDLHLAEEFKAKGLSLRAIAEAMNQERPKQERVSYSSIRRLFQKAM